MEHVAEILQRCREQGLTVAVAESLTVGNIQAALGSVSGSSIFFRGGVTAYTLEAKVGVLGVDRGHAEKVNCVSEDVAQQMAQGVALLFGADLGVSTTGYAEPDLTSGVADPYAYYAIASQEKTLRYGQQKFPGLGRVQVQQAVTEHVLAALLRQLQGCED